MGTPPAESARFNLLLASAVERGLPLGHALALAAAQARSRRLRRGLAGAAEALRDGAPLGEALGRHPEAFPEDYRRLVEMGLAVGALAPVLRRVATFRAMEARARRGERRTAVYLGTGVLLATGVLWQAAEAGRRVEALAIETGVDLPAITQMLIDFARVWWVLPLAMGGAWLAWLALRGTAPTAWALRRVPVLGAMHRSRDLAVLCTALGVRLHAGGALPEALRETARALDRRHLVRVLDGVRRRVEEGEALSSALYYEPFFPRSLAWAASLGEARGGLAEVFDLHGDLHATELEDRFEVFITLLTPLGVLFLANLVLFVALAMLMPIITLIQKL